MRQARNRISHASQLLFADNQLRAAAYLSGKLLKLVGRETQARQSSRQRKDVTLRADDKAANASERVAEQTSPLRRRSVPFRGLSAGNFFDQFVGGAIRMALLEKAKNVTDGESPDRGRDAY